MSKKLQKKKGFTIIEVLISLAVFAVIVIPISLILMQGVTTNKKAEQKQQAMMIAQDIFETLKGYTEDQFIGFNSLEVRDQKVIKTGNTLSGVVDGYDITGHIKAVDGYEFKNENMDLNKGFVVDINKSDKKLKLREIQVLKNKSSQIYIDGRLIDKVLENPIYLIINESCDDKIRFNMKNESDVEELIYIIKKEGSEASYEINNIGGVFNIISDIVIPDKESKTVKKLYEIYIKASKNGNYFEVKSYKNIKWL